MGSGAGGLVAENPGEPSPAIKAAGGVVMTILAVIGVGVALVVVLGVVAMLAFIAFIGEGMNL